MFRERNPLAASFRVELAGSLAATGRGHLTDTVIISNLVAPVEIVWSPDLVLPSHPNGMRFWAFDAAGDRARFLASVQHRRGGALSSDRNSTVEPGHDSSAGARRFVRGRSAPIPILFRQCARLSRFANPGGIPLWQLAFQYETDIHEYLSGCWTVMSKAVARGLETEGSLPGSLKLVRKASSYIIQSAALVGRGKKDQYHFRVCARRGRGKRGGGSRCDGTDLRFLRRASRGFAHSDGRRKPHGRTDHPGGWLRPGIVGNLVKVNASISGAEVGCQGEIGTGVRDGRGRGRPAFGRDTPADRICGGDGPRASPSGSPATRSTGSCRFPASSGMPWPRAAPLDCAIYALLSDGSHRVSFDMVVKTMYETGRDPYVELFAKLLAAASPSIADDGPFADAVRCRRGRLVRALRSRLPARFPPAAKSGCRP